MLTAVFNLVIPFIPTTDPASMPLMQGFVIWKGEKWRLVVDNARRKVVDLMTAGGGQPHTVVCNSGRRWNEIFLSNEAFARYKAWKEDTQ